MRAIILTALLLCFASSSSNAQDRFAELEATIKSEIEATRTPGAAVAIVQDDRVVYAKGFGMTSVEGGANVSTDTLFRIGSTTKMFTAAAFAVMVDRGKLQFDKKVATYLPGLPPKVGSLTAHQLLSQSSGLRDFGTEINSDDDTALAANISGWKDDVFFSDPDTIYSYSSANFWLAGLIVEKSNGKAYADSMNELLFHPLGMKRTFLRPREAMTYPLALGHNRQGTVHSVNRPASNNAAIYPGGSIFSSVNELSRWAIALMNNGMLDGKQALPASVVAQLMKPQFYLPGEDKVFYSYGLMGYEIGGVPTISHGGVSRGYGSTIFFAPQQKIAVIVLTNSNGQTLAKTRNKANEILLPLKAAVETPFVNADNGDDLTKYAGVFRHTPQTWEFSVRDGKLFVTSEGTESELKAVGKNEFSGTLGSFLFVPNKQGTFEHIFMGLYAARRVS